MTTTRERRHKNVHDHILATARQLIIEKGADGLSLREIARRIDYSPAGLYEYFGSKEEIIQAVCFQSEAVFLAYLKRVPLDLPVDEYLVELGLAYVQFAKENPEPFIFMFNYRQEDFGETPPNFTETDESSFMVLYNGVQRGIDAGQIKTNAKFNTLEAAYSLWAVVHGMAMLQVKYLKNFPLNFPETDRTALQAFVIGLGQNH